MLDVTFMLIIQEVTPWTFWRPEKAFFGLTAQLGTVYSKCYLPDYKLNVLHVSSIGCTMALQNSA